MSSKPVKGMEVHTGDVSVYILIERLKFGDGQIAIYFSWIPENILGEHKVFP